MNKVTWNSISESQNIKVIVLSTMDVAVKAPNI